MTDMAPAPNGVLKYVRSKSKTSSTNPCSTNMCTCRKSGLKCITACCDCRGEQCRNAVPAQREEYEPLDDASIFKGIVSNVFPSQYAACKFMFCPNWFTVVWRISCLAIYYYFRSIYIIHLKIALFHFMLLCFIVVDFSYSRINILIVVC